MVYSDISLLIKSPIKITFITVIKFISIIITKQKLMNSKDTFVYHNFVNFAKDSFTNKLSILTNFVFKTKCNTKGCNIVKRNAIPTF